MQKHRFAVICMFCYVCAAKKIILKNILKSITYYIDFKITWDNLPDHNMHVP